MTTWKPAMLFVTAATMAAVSVPILAEPSRAAVPQPHCVFSLISVKALDLQESDGDEIYLRLDGVRFPHGDSVSFTSDGQVRLASSFGSPVVEFPRPGQNYLFVNVVEDDLLLDDDIGNTVGVSCAGPFGPRTFVFQDRTASYRLTYDVEAL
jgi:hypothetical protein